MMETDSIERMWKVMVLRLLSQILIKLAAGPAWGVGETELRGLLTEADEIRARIEAKP